MTRQIKSCFGCSRSLGSREASLHEWHQLPRCLLGKQYTNDKLSIRFLEYIEDYILLQMLDMLTRTSAFQDLALKNWEGLLDKITTSSSLGYSNHNLVEFKILLNTLKTSSRTKTLDIRRTNFNTLRAQLWGISWEASKEGKAACEFSELLKNKTSPPSTKGKRAEQDTTLA